MGSRNARQCRERWRNYLSPELRTDEWTPEEDLLLEELFSQVGPKWNTIGQHFTSRSDMSLRNRHQVLVRRARKMAFDEWATADPFQETGDAIVERPNQGDSLSRLMDLFGSPEPDITFFTENPPDPWQL
jgi:hypothetical protein